MTLLRRVLYLDALVSALGGLGLLFAPGLLVTGLFGQPEYPDYTWVRLVGVQALSLSLLLVLVGQRADELWWWSWAFVAVAAGTAAVTTLHAAFGVPPGASPWLWWLLALVSWAFAGGLVWGLARAGLERPAG